jgi:ribosomal protein S18 acetylase RimI-like enzyme
MKTTPGSWIQEQSGAMIFTIGRPAASGHLNGALRIDAEADAAQVLAGVRRFFESSDPEFIVWVRDEADADLERALLDEGFATSGKPDIPCMIRRRPFEKISPPADIELRSVRDEGGARDYARVTASAFGMTEEVALAVFGKVRSLVGPAVVALVAYRETIPIAAAMTLLVDDVAGLYYVGTVPEARGRGLGELCTRVATNAGFDRGARFVVLQASVAGEPLYRRIGYEVLTHYRWYRLPPG